MYIKVADIDNIIDLVDLSTIINNTNVKLAPFYFKKGTPNYTYFENLIQKNSSEVLIAIDNDIIIGFISITLNSSPEIEILHKNVYTTIIDLVVLEEYRRKGVATILVNKAEEWAKRRSDYIDAFTLAENIQTKSLFEKNNYSQLSVSYYKKLK